MRPALTARSKMRDMSVEPRCRKCGTTYPMMIDPDDYALWKGGVYAQQAFPYLTAGERELLISATCDDCWSKLFGGWDD